MVGVFRKNDAAVDRLSQGRVTAAFALLAAMLFAASGPLDATAGTQQTIPRTQTTALDGKTVNLPDMMPGRATVLILGFGRKSVDATTAWEKPVRGSLAHAPEIGFYDMAMLAEVPGFVRGMVLHSIRNDVPDVLKPNFLPIFKDEDSWKRAAGYDETHPDAAYVMLVDQRGTVRWSTHEAYNEERFALMAAQAKAIASESR